MQTNQNTETINQAETQVVQNKPEKKFRAGALSISVWNNSTQKDGKVAEYKTVTLARSYKKDGVWQNSAASLRVNDLPKLSIMLDEAYKYLIMRGGEESLVL